MLGDISQNQCMVLFLYWLLLHKDNVLFYHLENSHLDGEYSQIHH